MANRTNHPGKKSDKEWRNAIRKAVHELVEATGEGKAKKTKALTLMARKLVAKAITVNVAERPLLAREIIAGGRLLKANKDVAPSAPERQGAIANVFGTGDRSVFTPDTATALAPILNAATALYAGRQVPTGDWYSRSSSADLFPIIKGVWTIGIKTSEGKK